MGPSRRLGLSLFILSVVGLCPVPRAQQVAEAPASAETLAKEATFIFAGTVRRVNASTMAEVPSSASTAVVRVDEVIEAEGAPSDLKGAEITVQLAAPGSFKAGEHATFFTRGWLMGDSLVVVELGHTSEHSGAEEVRGLVAGAHQKVADEALQSEIGSAEVIVVGTVVGVKPAGIRHVGSEHDPDWYEAEISADTVEKGSLPGHTVMLLFPHSNDLMWQGAPRFTKGEQGIWLLHRNQQSWPGIQDRYTALNPLDFQGPENLAHIRALEKAAR